MLTEPAQERNLHNTLVTPDPTTAQMLAIQLTQAHTAMRAVRSVLKAVTLKAKTGSNAACIAAALSILDENLQ